MNTTPTWQTADGRPITERRVRRGIRISIMAGCLGMSWWAMTQGMTVTLFMEALGASGVLIGLAASVQQVAFLVQVPFALVAERLRSRKPFWASVMLFSRLLWFGPLVFLVLWPDQPDRVAVWMVWFVALASVLGMGMSALWYRWMSDLVPEPERGRFWGTRQSITTTAFLLATLVVGLLLDGFPTPLHGSGSWTGFKLVFAIGAVLGMADILIHLLVPEPYSGHTVSGDGWWKPLVEPLRNRDFRRLILSMGIFSFSVGLTAMGLVCLRQDFHVTYTQIAMLNIASALGAIVFGFIWGYVCDRIGSRAFGAIMMLLAPVTSISWFFVRPDSMNVAEFTQPVWLLGPVIRQAIQAMPAAWETTVLAFTMPHAMWIFLGLTFLGGAFFNGIGICQLNMSSSLAIKQYRTTAIAEFWAGVGVIGSLGALVAGRVMDYLRANPIPVTLPNGVPLLYHHVLIGAYLMIACLVALPLFLSITRRKDEPPVRAAMSRLLTGNPLRVVTNIYLMGTAVTSFRRAQAARNLGEERSAMAVGDLIEKLDDPSLDVREEAAQALGSIGTEEAADALVRKLDDPQSDMAPQIARALRKVRHPGSVEALLRKLRDPDRETRSESARALGEIGDPRAISPLMDLLTKTDDSKVVSSFSEALARLGETDAIYEILPRLKNTHNRVLKRSLAVAVGDLLGGEGRFYRVFAQEENSYGSGVHRILRGFRRAVIDSDVPGIQQLESRLVADSRRIQSLYEAHAHAECASVLFDTAVCLAEARWRIRFGGDVKAWREALALQDERFAVGAWYLDLLRTGWEAAELGQRDHVDVLLGIHFLCAWGVEQLDPDHADETGRK